MAIDPFKLDGPTCISLSGGRTSGYMLHRVLQSNGGLPDGSLVLFCNTGKEEEATLRFVRDMAEHWQVPVTWLEYRIGGQFEVVTFDTASRAGEPYEQVIQQRNGVLPNLRARYCSSEMKTRTMHRYLRSLGWDEWETMIGIRADEPRRAAKFRFNPHPETKSEYVRVPLVDAFVSARDVGAFWQSQPFDLGLPNMNGKTMHGNCDLCFLKPAKQVLSLIQEKPERAVWWAAQEAKAAKSLPKREWDEPVMERLQKSDADFAAEMAEFEGWLDSDGGSKSMDEDEIEACRPRPFAMIPKMDSNGAPVVLHHRQPNTGALFRNDRPSYMQMAAFAEQQTDMFDQNEEAISCFCGD